MKHSAALLSIVGLALGVGRGFATPADNEGLQVVLGELRGGDGVLGDVGRVVEEIERVVEGVVEEVVEGVGKFVGDAGERVEKWMEGGREFVRQHGHTYELFTHPQFKDHSLRVTKPTLCDADVKQYSGYLDITDGKHLFFWFFEARNSPKTAPLLMWLNGGPGCSSMTGLLFENGPCRVSNEGFNTTNNPYSWNTDANMLFLDQPVNVGYSYSDDGSTVNTTPVAGLDVYAFLELFLTHFKEYSDAPFHLAAESYGGTYAPHFAAEIHARNKALDEAPSSKGLVKINLASVILANGHTDPLLQFPTIPTFACEGPYPIYDDPAGAQCQSLRSKVPTCERLVKACYDYGSRLTCVPATLYCNSQLWAPIQQLGLNPYDVRKKCNREEDGSLCYKEMVWLDTWMNIDENKKMLGVDPSRKFDSCNMQVNQAFLTQGDSSHNSAPFLVDLINEGVRVLVYAGNADYMCNFIGNEAWLLDLDTIFKAEFNAAKSQPWVTLDSGEVAGVVRSAGGNGFGAGNVTFVAVHEAGHMVPYDQPERAFDLITRWLSDVPLSLNATETAQVMFGGW